MNFNALNALIPVFDFIGIVAFALSGVFAGMRRKIDPVGVFIVAFSTAFGGGMLRDIIIDRRPFYWIDNESYVLAVFIICLLAPLIDHWFSKRENAKQWYLFADAIGLGVFCISGTSLSLEANVPFFSSVIIGCITGVFGGLMRDVFLNRLPGVVADRQPYASVGFVGCWLFIILLEIDVPMDWAVWSSMIFIVALRVLCIIYGWKLAYIPFNKKIHLDKLK